MPILDALHDANIISSHTLNKIKIEDDGSLQMKARTFPHGNEEFIKHVMNSNCCMCSPMGIRLTLAITAIRRWTVTKANVKSVFLQTGHADHNVYVCSPRESFDKRHYLLLLPAANGFVNANAKFQAQSDVLIISTGLSHLAYVPRLFHCKDGEILVLLVAKSVDDIRITGESVAVEHSIDRFN